MRAASPTAAEGRPHNLALVAVLGLVRQTDIWTGTNKEAHELTDKGTQGYREEKKKKRYKLMAFSQRSCTDYECDCT